MTEQETKAAAEHPPDCRVMPSKLVNGLIPPHTTCPFAGRCADADTGLCRHKGVYHTTTFSCGFARAYDLLQRGGHNIKSSPLADNGQREGG